MAPDDASAPKPPVVLRIKLRYEDADAMVQRFAVNVGKTGLFLPTKSLQPLGADVKFELRLANDTPVLVGLGRVKAVQPPDPAHPKAIYGMSVELLRVTKESRELILRMLEQRKKTGLPEVGLPLPADIESYPRASTQPPEKTPASGATPVPLPIATPPIDSEPLLTSPRRQSGPIAIAKLAAPAPLAPEAPRRARTSVQEVIERASGPIASVQVIVPGLDEDVDVGAAIARARLLSVGDMDVELAALREAAAAPFAIDVESASAELAKQLGGAAVKRDRSARWAPPPATSTPVAKIEPVLEAKVEPTPIVEARVEPTPIVEAKVEPAPIVEAKVEPARAPIIARPATEPVADDDVVETTDAHRVGTEPVADEDVVEATPSDGGQPAGSGRRGAFDTQPDPEPYEPPPTRIVEMAPAPQVEPEPYPPKQPAKPLSPLRAALLAKRPIPAQPERYAALADAPIPVVDGPAPAAPVPTPRESSEDIETLDASDLEEVEETQVGEIPVQPELTVDAEIESSRATHAVAPPTEDFEVLAEEEPIEPPPPIQAPASMVNISVPERPSDIDFAARLDLGDESDVPRRRVGPRRLESVLTEGEEDDEFTPSSGAIDPRTLSTGYALSQFEEPRSADELPEDFELAYTPVPGQGLPRFDDSDVIRLDQAKSIKPKRPDSELSAALDALESPRDDLDSALADLEPDSRNNLDHALDGLDVDMDDLEIPVAHVPRPPVHRGPPPPPRGATPARAPRAASDGGVIIDFDDEDGDKIDPNEG